jgi:rod shape-determining protein MreD
LFAIFDATPDLVLILVLVVSFRENRTLVLIFAFLGGLLQDVFVTDYWGLSALTKLIVAMIGTGFQRADQHYPLSYFASVFGVLIFLHEFLYQIFLSIGSQVPFGKTFIQVIIPCVFYTFIVSLLMYFLFHHKLWKSRVGKSF